MSISLDRQSFAAPVRTSVVPAFVHAFDGERCVQRPDRLAAEEPLELRVALPGVPAVPLTVTMRTPGHDFELAAGFLLAEGVIGGADDIASIRYCTEAEQQHNVVTIDLRRAPEEGLRPRAFATTSACGVCGTASIDALERRGAALAAGPVVEPAVLAGLPDALRARQRAFDRTGGVHACGLFAADGELLSVREDVGRHNALDKLVGQALLAGRLPLADRLVLVSGRASFELVQKAALAGAPVLCAVSAPSSLAVSAARRLGVTLVGFLRGQRFNVYTHAGRVAGADAGVAG